MKNKSDVVEDFSSFTQSLSSTAPIYVNAAKTFSMFNHKDIVLIRSDSIDTDTVQRNMSKFSLCFSNAIDYTFTNEYDRYCKAVSVTDSDGASYIPFSVKKSVIDKELFIYYTMFAFTGNMFIPITLKSRYAVDSMTALNHFKENGIVISSYKGTKEFDLSLFNTLAEKFDVYRFTADKDSSLSKLSNKIFDEFKEYLIKIRKEKFESVVKEVTLILEAIYPNNYELILDSDLGGNLIIRFPEITVTNSQNKSHNIVDLFVAVHMASDFRIAGISGARSTVTISEYNASYAHSHLPSTRDFYNFNTFCLGGSSTEISLCMSAFNARIDLTELDWFEAFLLQLKQYVAWESLEGVPYNKMSGIAGAEYSNNINFGSIENFLNGTAIKIEALFLDNDGNYVFNSAVKYKKEECFSSIEIDFNNKTVLSNLTKLAPPQWKCIRGNNGIYYNVLSEASLSNAESNVSGRYIYFKGKKVPARVIQNSNTEHTNAELVIHPSYIEQISKLLNKKINNYLTKKIKYEW